MTITPNQFITMLSRGRLTIEALAHQAQPTYGDIFKWLDRESKIKDGRIESEVLMCCDLIMNEERVKEMVRTLTENVSAFEIHKNHWFELQIVTDNLQSQGERVDNFRLNKFMLILRSEP